MRAALVGTVLAAVALGLGACPAGDTASAFTYRSAAARNPGPAPDLGARRLRVLHFGDFGDGTEQQGAVAAAMAAAQRRDPFDLAVSVGDNLYPCGPNPTVPGADACAFDASGNAVAPGFGAPDDPLFASRFERPLAPLADAPAVPVWVTLGNHDVATWSGCGVDGPDRVTLARRRACLEVAHASPLWRMPARHYVVDQGPVRLIALDANLVEGDYGGFSFDDEVRFLRESVAGCADRACFVLGHQPPATAGGHSDGAGAPTYLARMKALEAASGGLVRAWLAGHDHDLQHVRTAAGLDVFVSGNTARGRPRERFGSLSAPGARLEFASVRWGYGVLEIHDGGWTYRFEDDGGAPRYCCAAVGAGPCEPVRCAP